MREILSFDIVEPESKDESLRYIARLGGVDEGSLERTSRKRRAVDLKFDIASWEGGGSSGDWPSAV